MNAVEEYIKKEMEKGVPLNSIKKALLDVGHDIEKVEAHIKSEEEKLVRKKVMSDKGADKKLDAELLKYIDRSIENGHSLDEISSTLLKAGHNSNNINRHIKHIKKPKHDKMFIFLFLIVIMTGFIVWALFFHKAPEIQPSDTEICVGDCTSQRCIDDCYNDFYFQKAIIRENATFCIGISIDDLRTECNDEILKIIAQRESSIETCLEIVNDTKQEKCVSTIIMTKASIESNLSLCDKITNEQLQQNCRENYLHNQAVRNMDIEMCNDIGKADRKESCRSTILQRTAIIEEDITICDALDDSLHCKNEFYYNAAVRNLNIEECQKILDSNRKQLCQDLIYQSLAIQDKNPELCEAITDNKILENCRRNVK